MPEHETIVVVGYVYRYTLPSFPSLISSRTVQTNLFLRAGVIGLSTALCIQQHLTPLQSVVIVARDFPNTTSINYATPWAGAHYRPIPGKTPQIVQEATWAKRTYDVFQHIATEEPAASGVQFLFGEEYLQKPSPEYLDAVADVSKSAYGHLLRGFKRLSVDEIGNSAVCLGIRYWTYCVNSPVYAAYLLRKFVLKGGRTRAYTLVVPDEAFSLEPNVTTVVNCSGLGFGDPKSFIIRGLFYPLTCLVYLQVSSPKTDFRSQVRLVLSATPAPRPSPIKIPMAPGHSRSLGRWRVVLSLVAPNSHVIGIRTPCRKSDRPYCQTQQSGFLSPPMDQRPLT